MTSWTKLAALDAVREGTRSVESGPAELDRLLARCLDGDNQAFRSVYDLYAAPLLRLVVSLLGHREDAEEVVQDSFEYAFRRLQLFDPGKASFKTWLTRIAVSRARNKRRRSQLPTVPLAEQEREVAADAKVAGPEKSVLVEDSRREVWHALGQLSSKLRDVAVLRYFGEFSYQEIGHILGIPVKTAESRMRLAHKTLRGLLIKATVLTSEGD